MKITVKPLKGDNFEVETSPEATIESVKRSIAAMKSEYPADLQKLIYSGRILKDDSTVGELNIKPEEFIVVMVAKAKAPAAPAAATTPAATPAPAAPGAAAPTGEDPAAAAAANLVSGAGMEATITQLCDMGFPRPEVERCLMAAFNNPDRAVEYLTNGIPEGILQPPGGEGAPPAGPGGGAGRPPAPQPTPAAGGAGMGGASPFPAMTGGGGGGGGGVAIPPALQELRNNPQFAQLSAMLAQNPAMLANILPALQASNPELLQVIRQHPDAFMQLINEAGGGGGQDPVAAMLAAAQAGGGGGGEGGGPQVIRLSEEDRAAVERLAALGFDRNMAAQAYFACDKNEELAANFLFDSGGDAMQD